MLILLSDIWQGHLVRHRFTYINVQVLRKDNFVWFGRYNSGCTPPHFSRELLKTQWSGYVQEWYFQSKRNRNVTWIIELKNLAWHDKILKRTIVVEIFIFISEVILWNINLFWPNIENPHNGWLLEYVAINWCSAYLQEPHHRQAVLS